ncbi:CPBP family intramembrane glutamate endopeptidase, partial [Vibrio rotiferianus]
MILDSAIWLWGLLILATGAVFFRQKAVALVLLGLTLLSALFIGRIELIAFASTLVVLGVAYRLPMLASNQKTKPVYYLGLSAMIIWCVMLFVHLIPGFNNLQVLDKVTAGPLSAPFSMYLNLDKPLALFALFLAYPFLLGSEAKG